MPNISKTWSRVTFLVRRPTWILHGRGVGLLLRLLGDGDLEDFLVFSRPPARLGEREPDERDEDDDDPELEWLDARLVDDELLEAELLELELPLLLPVLLLEDTLLLFLSLSFFSFLGSSRRLFLTLAIFFQIPSK